MLVLNVYYKVKPGKREEFYKVVTESGVAEASRKEAGNIRYEYFRAAEDPDLMLLIEHWKDQEAFDFHIQQPHFKELGRIKETYVADTDIMRFEA